LDNCGSSFVTLLIQFDVVVLLLRDTRMEGKTQTKRKDQFLNLVIDLFYVSIILSILSIEYIYNVVFLSHENLSAKKPYSIMPIYF